MQNIICENCGSNDINVQSNYYECNHCHTKYHPTLEMKKDERTKNFWSKYRRLITVVTIINILALNYYFLWKNKRNETIITAIESEKEHYISIPASSSAVMINNANAQIDSQSIVINNYNTNIEKNSIKKRNEIKYWNLLFERDKLSQIRSLVTTEVNSYLIAGDDSNGNVHLSELDKNGKEIWSKTFSNNVQGGHINAVMLKNGYLLSYKGSKSKNVERTIMLNFQRKIVYTLPISFNAMVATESGFIGVTDKAIHYINKEGNVVWKRSLNRTPGKLVYNKIVKLKDNNFVEIGSDINNMLWVTKYRKNGDIIWQHKSSTYKVYIKDVVSTSDGGFIVSAGRYIKILKYNSDGELDWSSKVPKYRSAFVHDIIEANDGYLITASVLDNLLVAKLDYDGNVLWDKEHKANKRIRARNIVKAFDGGYLLSVNRDIEKPWLCKMSKDGEIRTDFDNENYQLGTTNRLLHKDVSSRKDKFITNLTKTEGNCNRIILSKNEQYAYVTGLAGGFHIFDMKDSGNPFLLSVFSKSKTKFKRYNNGAFGPVSRSVNKLTGDYQYNKPQNFTISKDEKKAFIIDAAHGFYILNIEDKKSPKLLASLKNLKGTSLALSKDNKIVFLPIVDKNGLNLLAIDVENPNAYQIYNFNNIPVDTSASYTENPTNLIIPSSDKVAILSYEDNLIIFNLKRREVIKQIKTAKYIDSITLSDNKKKIYVSMNNGIDIYDIPDMKLQGHIHLDDSYNRYCTVSKDNTKLYTGSTDKGVQVLDISNINSPKKIKIYKNMRNAGAYSVTLSKNEQRLYIAFGMAGMGIVDIQ